jgi:hypothetical protein
MISPKTEGASRSSPGPVKLDMAMLPPAMTFFQENETFPLRVIVGDIAIMEPAEKIGSVLR